MRRRGQAQAQAAHQEPLSERVDRAGVQQYEDPAAARLSRTRGRIAAALADDAEPEPSDVEEIECECE
jgi:hypothetical protein